VQNESFCLRAINYTRQDQQQQQQQQQKQQQQQQQQQQQKQKQQLLNDDVSPGNMCDGGNALFVAR